MSVLLSVTVSAGLAVVFAMVLFMVREQALTRRYSELEVNVQRIEHDWTTPESIHDVQDDFPNLDLAVYSREGKLISSTTKKAPSLLRGKSKTGDVMAFGLDDGRYVFVGAISWTETEAGLKQLAAVLITLWFPLAALTAAVSWYGGGLVLRPVTELVESAKKLSGTAEGDFLVTSDHAEFGALAGSLNQFIGRIRQSARVQEQFASDAAHELRNPLAVLRTRIETNLMRERTPQEHVNSQRAMIDQIDRLTSLVETLLYSARHGSSISATSDFGDSVRASVEEWTESKGWSQSRIQMSVVRCHVPISHEEIGIILRNLLDNAARHTPDNCPIEVSVCCVDGVATLSVRDFGPGLNANEMALAFERFYRSDEGRNRQHGGAGIGLAVVKRIAEAHSGSVQFVEVEKGALVRVTVHEAQPDNHLT